MVDCFKVCRYHHLYYTYSSLFVSSLLYFEPTKILFSDYF